MDEGQKWVSMVKEEVNKTVEELEPSKAYGALIYLEQTVSEAYLYIRQKRIAHANKYHFKHR